MPCGSTADEEGTDGCNGMNEQYSKELSYESSFGTG